MSCWCTYCGFLACAQPIYFFQSIFLGTTNSPFHMKCCVLCLLGFHKHPMWWIIDVGLVYPDGQSGFVIALFWPSFDLFISFMSFSATPTKANIFHPWGLWRTTFQNWVGCCTYSGTLDLPVMWWTTCIIPNLSSWYPFSPCWSCG